MARKRFTEEQISFALRQHEGGIPAEDIIRKLGVSSATFYNWKRKFQGMGLEEIRRLKQLEDENKRLKQMVADLSLDRQVLQEALRKKL